MSADKTRWTFVMDLPLDEGPWTPERARAYVEDHLNEGQFYDSFKVLHAHPFGEANPIKAEELLPHITSEPCSLCGQVPETLGKVCADYTKELLNRRQFTDLAFGPTEAEKRALDRLNTANAEMAAAKEEGDDEP
jgi:hypothetical protein